ncbi:MAG: response regulator transcription factor [Phycisphaerae bacterium]|nr:response regulator transcription factor [Phycisphaerae bacterium]
MKSILIVEDEADLAEVLHYQLKREGFDCRVAGDGAAALAEIERHPPDLVVLDRMLPKASGDEVAMKLKSDPRLQHIPVIMVTAKAEETDELVGFAIGADDYIRKPFSPKLLIARIQAVLRRQESTARSPEVISSGPVVLDRGRHVVTVEGEQIPLTATELRVLSTLMSARGRVLSREQVIDAVLGYGVAVTQRTIDVHVAALRKKMAAASGWIQTVRGVGYAFRPPGEGSSGKEE